MKTLRIGVGVLGMALLAAALPGRGEMVTRRWGKPPSGPPAKKAAKPLARPPTCYVARAAAAPKVDGTLDDPAWKKARACLLARTLDGAGRAAQPTEVRLLRDERKLYLAFRCGEPLVGRLQASRRAHDGAIWEDDSVEIFLGVGGTYYHLGVNAVGSTYDAKVKDRAWSSSCRAAAGRESGAWTVELAVPLASMVPKGKPPGEWTANFNRNRRVTGQWEEFAWSPTYSADSHVPGRFGRMLFRDPPAGQPAPGPTVPAARTKSVEVLPAKGGLGVVRFDLSGLRRGTRIYRADLLIFRTQRVDGRMPEALVDIEIRPLLAEFTAGGEPRGAGKPLKLRPPWFDRFDAADAVRQWVAGKPNGGFFVKACPFWHAEATCLDVAYEGKPGKLPPQATELEAFHRAGQTFLTWREIDDPVARDEIAWGELKAILDGLDSQRRVRYCVYRHGRPITAGNLHEAELLAVVQPLSCWNADGRNVDRPVDRFIATHDVLMVGHWNPFRSARLDGQYGRDCPIDRFAIRDGGRPLPRGTGLYVHTAARKANACYAVVTSIDGVQNTAALSAANALREPVAESPAQPQPVLQRELPKMRFFNYDQRRLHYVRWVGPPLAHLPRQAHNWTVGVPARLAQRVPLELSLHRDGHSYWRTQYRIERDSIVLCPYDYPVRSWWYGHHEALGTLRSFRRGAIRPYTERRLLSFVEWACRKWPVDRARILVTGCRGGASGSGALRLGLRHPDVFNLVIAGHPVIDYAAASRRTDRHGLPAALSMQAVWGRAEWNLPDADGKSFWRRHDMVRLVRSLPAAAEPPFVAMTSGHTDAASRRFYEAMLARRAGIVAEFAWGGTRYLPVSRTGTMPNVIRLDIRRDRCLLAMGSPAARKYAAAGGMGEFHRQFRWRDVRDEPDRLEATILLRGGRESAADVTPRRCRRFRAVRGRTYAWRNVSLDGKTEHQSGRATAGDDGLLVLAKVRFTSEGSRLVVTAQ